MELDLSILSILTPYILLNTVKWSQFLLPQHQARAINSSGSVILLWTLIRSLEDLYSTGSYLYATHGQRSKKFKKVLEFKSIESARYGFMRFQPSLVTFVRKVICVELLVILDRRMPPRLY